MYIKRIEITGFKSFANRTVIDLEPKLSSIVGPNGCGKSNVTDAIRWVLGEQSPKSLRGKKMEDIIFGGTADKKPLSRAEVSLSFADCEGVLPIDYHEVTITRRLYRSGESEYLLNNKNCRLREIKEMFLGTGIGTNAYYLMQQGKIESILNAKPEERRAIFEEAAGITKFKSKKIETLNKLKHVDDNLTRLRDLIREVKRQSLSLQRQAGKAKKYREITEQLKKLEIEYYAWEFHSLNNELSLAGSDIGSIKTQETDLINSKNEIDASIEELERKLKNVSNHKQSLNEELNKLKWDLEKFKENIDRYSKQKSEYHNQIEEYDQEKENAIAKKEAINLESNEKNNDLNILIEKEKDFSFVKDREELVVLLTEKLKNKDSELNTAKKELADVHHLSVETSTHLENINNQITQLEENQTHQLELLDQVDCEKNSIIAQSNSFKTESENIINSINSEHQNKQNLNQKLDKYKSDFNVLNQKKSDLEKYISEQSSRCKTLKDLQNDLAGYLDSVKKILKEYRLTQNDGVVLGSLADFLDIPSQYQQAIAVALGDQVQDILIKDIDEIKNAVSYLKENQLGHVGFISLDLFQDPSQLTQELPQYDCIQGFASDVITIDGENAHIIKSMLNRIVLVDNAENLIKIAPTVKNTNLFWVSLDGLLIRPGGTIKGGGKKDASINILERKKQVQKLENQIQKLEEDLINLNQELNTLQNNIDQLIQDVSDSQNRLNVLNIQKAETAKAIDHLEDKLNSINLQKESHSKNYENDKNLLVRKLEEQKIRKDHIVEQNKQITLLETQINSINAEYEFISQQKESAFVDWTEAKIEKSSFEEKKNQLKQRCTQIQSEINELDQLIKKRTLDVDLLKSKIIDMDSHAAQDQININSNEEKINQTNAKLLTCENEEKLLDQELESLNQKLELTSFEIDQLKENHHSKDIFVAELKTKQQNIIETVKEKYELAIEECSPPDLNQIDGIKNMIKDFKNQLEKMGPVNLVAIEEYDEVKERYEFLVTQEQDLINSKNSLEEAISKIEETTTQMFEQTFNTVRNNFRNIFSKLFGGGSADVILVDDNVLESGVDIVASPPGKKLTSIHLLSGGEKSMTALALLMSLFKVKPSPFCLMDEMDAALDDDNVSRFVNLVKEFSSDSQFIIITHNKITMAASSVIYGVTMEQHGISQIISVKLKEATIPEKNKIESDMTEQSTVMA